MKYKTVNDEVLYTDEAITTLSSKDMGTLVEKADLTERKRVRLCTHQHADHPLHQMFIVLGKETYIRPHYHTKSDESFHVLSGEVDVVFFDEQGQIETVYSLGDYASGKPFYCRIPANSMHMVIIRSQKLVFCEATLGPFKRGNMIFAQWSPEENSDEAWEYIAQVSKLIEKMK